jgi:hypothetical protein
MPHPETELHCELVILLLDKGVSEAEVSRVLLEAAINTMVSEGLDHETIKESVEMILEEDNEDDVDG